MVEKLRTPQQAGVGTKTRSAERTPARSASPRAEASHDQPLTRVRPWGGIEEVTMDVAVTGRHCEVSDKFRSHVEEKLTRLEKHDHRIIRVSVEVEDRHSRNPERALRVQLTAFSKGPVIRAEASAENKMAALDLALDKIQSQMRRAADRRRVHHGRRKPVSVAEATGDLPLDGVGVGDASADEEIERKVGPISVTGDGPMVVREKSHAATPMTLDQALYEMELVGHDFYLFVDKESERPSVVYRRKGYDYGVITLDLDGQ